MTDRPARSLIAGCLAGDDTACAALFERYKALAYRTAYLMLDDAADAEDVLQDVFAQAFRSLHTYDAERAAFSTWLHRITVNVCLGRRRRAGGPPLVSLEDEYLPDLADAQADFTDTLSLAEQAGHLLAALDDDQRAVVVLRFYWDLAYREIADILGVPLGTVQSRLSRALKRMRAHMRQRRKEEG